MRHGLRVIMTVMSCCFLYFVEGCESSSLPSNEDGPLAGASIGSQDKGVAKPSTDSPTKEDILPTDLAPIPVFPPLPPEKPAAIEGPEKGYGGGSQGALEPTRIGDSDEDEDERPPAVCGNGIQEVIGKAVGCIYGLYGSTVDPVTGASTLVAFDRSQHGLGYLVGPIGPNVEKVSAIDFSPD